MCTKEKCDIGIITVLTEETAAVIKALKLKKLERKFSKRNYYGGQIKKRTIALTQSLEQGNSSVVSAFDELVKNCNPHFVFLIGIAGRVKDTLDYCDVVVADAVYAYDFQRETDEGNQPRVKMLSSPKTIIPILQDLELECPQMNASEGSPQEQFTVKVGSIASGSRLIAADESETKNMLSKVTDKILAVEMEGYGFAEAYEENALSDVKVSGIIVIRGISDYAKTDKDRTKKYRKPAAENAAKVAKELIVRIPNNAFEDDLSTSKKNN